MPRILWPLKGQQREMLYIKFILCNMKNKAIRLLRFFYVSRRFTSFSVFGDHYAAYFLKPLNELNPVFNWTKIFLKPNFVILIKWLNKTAHATVLLRSEVLIIFLYTVVNAANSGSILVETVFIKPDTTLASFFIDIFRTLTYFITDKKSEVFFYF